MFTKLPADFNADWYRANYPDVAQSGMSAREHYLRFGRRMGRKGSGGHASAGRTETASESQTPDAELPLSPNSAEPSPQPGRPAIIDRPTDFDPADASPLPAPLRAMADSDQEFSLDIIGEGPFASPHEEARLRSTLTAYARMLSLQPPEASDECKSIWGAEFLRKGETRIENAWFSSVSKLRLTIAGGSGPASVKGWVLRAFQAEPANPDRLKMAGQGVQLPGLGPVFHDLDLIHPLMPLLLELSDADGVTRDFVLLPFPSLLPGGMHGAELRALQNEANPMDAFWSLSALLLQELLGRAEWKARSISALSIQEPGFTAENVPSTAIQEWIRAVFGLSVEPATAAAAPDSGKAEKRPKTRRGANQSRSSTKPASGEVRLVLPGNCLPTISGLVSRRIELGGAAHLTGPFLVEESRQFRPRWSVTLPADLDFGPAIPILRSVDGAVGAEGQPRCPVHLAIALRPANALSNLVNPSVANDQVDGALPDLTVVVDATDVTRTKALVGALRQFAGSGKLEILVRLSGNDDEFRTALDELCGLEAWTAVSNSADLRELAQSGANEIMLTVSDLIRLSEPHILSRLCSMLRSDETAASVSCMLLGERVIKKQAVLQPASAGLFPSHVSFANSPRLVFAEPDASQALPNLTYPVVANTMLLTVWRRSALADLPPPLGPVPPASADIRIGLDLLEAGYRNLCTTGIRVALSGAYVRRDAIDPVGSTYVRPDLWAHLLNRVTLLRELN